MLSTGPITRSQAAAAAATTSTTVPRPSLYLPETAGVTLQYLIALGPENSSGDIYHATAYLALCIENGAKVPSVLLTYDGVATPQTVESLLNTYSQVIRSLNFVKQLGLGQYFLPEERIDTGKNQRPGNRGSLLRSHLKAKHSTNHCIDQKATTTLVMKHFHDHGVADTTQKIRKVFANRNIPKADDDLIKHSASQEVELIRQESANKPILILHLRYSSNANKNQNVADNFPTKLRDYLIVKGYFCWVIATDGRVRKAKHENTTHVFPFYLSGNKTVDYGKLYHLEILDGLLKLPNLKGMIGNTSGTLDLAAFMGHPTYNIHQFKNQVVDYQGYRILVQSSLMSVESYDDRKISQLGTGKITEENIATFLPTLLSWLADKKPSKPSIAYAIKSLSEIGRLSLARNLFFITSWKDNRQVITALPCAAETLARIKK